MNFAAATLENSEERTDDKPRSSKAVRINITLTEKQYEELKAVANEMGTDMSEYVRTAVRLYTFLQREKQRGKAVYVGQNDQAEKEIVLP